MLRPAFLRKIEGALNQGPFSAADFRIRQIGAPDPQSQSILIIEYAYLSLFRLEAEMLPAGIKITVRPGEMHEEATTSTGSFDGLLAVIVNWLRYLEEDLAALGAHQSVETQREQIDAFMDQFGELDETKFSPGEVDNLRARLEQLEKELRDQVAKSSQDQAEIDARLQALTRDFEILSSTLSVKTKRQWAGTFARRAMDWLRDKDNRDLLKAGAELLRLLMGNDPPGGPGGFIG